MGADVSIRFRFSSISTAQQTNSQTKVGLMSGNESASVFDKRRSFGSIWFRFFRRKIGRQFYFGISATCPLLLPLFLSFILADTCPADGRLVVDTIINQDFCRAFNAEARVAPNNELMEWIRVGISSVKIQSSIVRTLFACNARNINQIWRRTEKTIEKKKR